MKKIVVISHESSLTGAPILLLNLLKLIKAQNKYEILIVLHRAGKIEDEFKKIYPTIVLKKQSYGNRSFIIQAIFDYLIFHYKVFKLSHKIKSYDLIFNNTITNGRLLNLLKKRKLPVITYIHELNSVINFYNINNDSKLTFELTNIYLCPTLEVIKVLKNDFGIENHKLNILRYYYQVPESNKTIKEIKRFDLAQKYQVSKNALWVVSCGMVSMRKGVDYFIETCINISKTNASIVFFWIGEFYDIDLKNEIMLRIKQEGLEKTCFFIGAMDWDINNLAPFDLFLLTSREDPYPLVVIEAALNHLPSIKFSNTGGIQEFVQSDAGWSIPDFSVNKVATLLTELSSNRDEINLKGGVANIRALEWHSNTNETLINFEKIIQKL
jgi:glycosyltransferase involved in cell wall biosynthesis